MRKYGLIATQVRLYYPVVVYKTRLSGWPEELVIPSNDWLAPLAARGATIMLGPTVEQLMDATGLAAEEITMHCLVKNYRPVLPPARISWGTRALFSPLERTSVTIEFNAGDLSLEELRALYNRYRRAMDLQRRKKLDEESARLLELVKKHCGLPPKGQVSFFRKLYERHYRDSAKVKSWENRRLQERMLVRNHEEDTR